MVDDKAATVIVFCSLLWDQQFQDLRGPAVHALFSAIRERKVPGLDRLANVYRNGFEKVTNPGTGDRTKVTRHESRVPWVEIARDEAQHPAAVSPNPVFISALLIKQLAPLVGFSYPFHIQAGGLSELEDYGFFGKELACDPLLFVKDGSVSCDLVVSSLGLAEPLLRIRFIGCAAVCDQRDEHE